MTKPNKYVRNCSFHTYDWSIITNYAISLVENGSLFLSDCFPVAIVMHKPS